MPWLAHHYLRRLNVAGDPHVPIPEPPQAGETSENDDHRKERPDEVPEILHMTATTILRRRGHDA